MMIACDACGARATHAIAIRPIEYERPKAEILGLLKTRDVCERHLAVVLRSIEEGAES